MKGIMLIEPLYVASFFTKIKTVTRRGGGLDAVNEHPDCYGLNPLTHSALLLPNDPFCFYLDRNGLCEGQLVIHCTPKYLPGEVVYVKEPVVFRDGKAFYPYGSDKRISGTTSKMFMPAKHARQFIQITSVRPERLHWISNKDAEHEGMGVFWKHKGEPNRFWYRYMFQTKWEEINGPFTWELNRWVWRYEYRPVTSLDALAAAQNAGEADLDSWVAAHIHNAGIDPTECVLDVPIKP